jgi:predicted  nucleic acid-binding Zn-ribbon protein
MTNQDITQLHTRFDGMSSRFDQMSTELKQLNSNFNELVGFLVDQFSKVATKDDLAELRLEVHQGFSEIRSEMATKGELAMLKTELKLEIGELREIVTRIDQRSDEDVKAVMKDVEKIKTYRVKRDHSI